jgi:hypothetical protein
MEKKRRCGLSIPTSVALCPVGAICPISTLHEAHGDFCRKKMPTEINREEVVTMAAVGAQLVEALPAKQYEEERLPGAINIPLKKLDSRTAATLDRNRPVIVYCYDYQ